MKITGLVVCVDYADFFERSIDLWADGLDSFAVITSPDDQKTIDLFFSRWGATSLFCHTTDEFYDNGCAFNKGLALSRSIECLIGIRWMFWQGWVLNIDADVVPPANWREIVEAANPQPGHLYTCKRQDERGRPINDGEPPGCFHLWHTSDPNVQRRPLFDCNWRHAGGYDSEFSHRWPREKRIWLPMTLTHLGAPGRHWWGRRNTDDWRKMMAHRNRYGRISPEERLDGKTEPEDWLHQSS